MCSETEARAQLRPSPSAAQATCASTCLTASISASMSTRSPTMTPPVSSTWFHASPKSLRSIDVFAVNAARTFPHGSFAWPCCSTWITTSRVAPLSVNSPTTSISPSERGWTRLPTKRSSGYCATSKKSGDFRCASRSATPVSMLDASIVTATVAFEKSPSGTWMVPDQRANDPRTLAITRCRTEKCRLEWLLSISQRSDVITPPESLRSSLGHSGRRKSSAMKSNRVFSSTYKSISAVSPSMAYRNDRLNSHFEMVSRRSHARRRSRYSRTAAFRSRGWAHHLRWRTRAPARCRRARAPQEGAHRDARRDSGAGRAHQVRLRTRMARRRNASQGVPVGQRGRLARRGSAPAYDTRSRARRGDTCLAQSRRPRRGRHLARFVRGGAASAASRTGGRAGLLDPGGLRQWLHVLCLWQRGHRHRRSLSGQRGCGLSSGRPRQGGVGTGTRDAFAVLSEGVPRFGAHTADRHSQEARTTAPIPSRAARRLDDAVRSGQLQSGDDSDARSRAAGRAGRLDRADHR